MRVNFLLIVALLLVASSSLMANILPPNNLHFEDGIDGKSNVSKDQFNAIIGKAIEIYEDRIAAHGKTLVFNRRWDDSTVNASANQWGSTWYVNMYGGLARRPEITPDGFALVVCHELGHHLAGYPFVSDWAADEGQSDYFATQACGRLFWQDDHEINALFRETIPSYPKKLCDRQYDETDNQNLCYRLMMAGKSLGDLLATLRGRKIHWDEKDTAVVRSTYHQHPQAQCRLDTYIQGALCMMAFDHELIPGKGLGRRRNSVDAEQEAAAVSCSRPDGFGVGVRPLCWFKPLRDWDNPEGGPFASESQMAFHY